MLRLLDYWTLLPQTVRGPQVIRNTLDIPLRDAIARSRRFTFWGIFCILTTWVTLSKIPTSFVLKELPRELYRNQLVHIVITCFLYVLMAALGYGFLRLYTLLSHVVITNIYKNRGQRLRLLNLETTVMTLLCPLCLGVVLTRWSLYVGWSFIVVVVVYATYLLSLGFTVIFHKRRIIHGLRLYFAGTITTSFILGLCAVGVAVAIAVLCLVVIVVLRSFHSRN